MRTRPRSTLLLLLSLLAASGCDVEETVIEDAALEERQATFNQLFEPFAGRWEGPVTHLGGIALFDYDATIVLNPDHCSVKPGSSYSAEWDYYNVPTTCTSELVLLGTSLAPSGIRTWTFFDHSLTGPCMDGYVDLTETADPAVLHYAWRTLGGVVDAEGDVARNGLCTPGFLGGGGGG